MGFTIRALGRSNAVRLRKERLQGNLGCSVGGRSQLRLNAAEPNIQQGSYRVAPRAVCRGRNVTTLSPAPMARKQCKPADHSTKHSIVGVLNVRSNEETALVVSGWPLASGSLLINYLTIASMRNAASGTSEQHVTGADHATREKSTHDGRLIR